MTKWTTSDLSPQRGRSAVITGTGGLGYETALVLARAGADVIVAGRDPAKGQATVARICDAVPNAIVQFELVDLASLKSIEAFGKRLRGKRRSLDLLINNAAVMTPPTRMETSDGFELQFGTNYLGHYALTAEVLPLLVQGSSPRVVTVSSVAARSGSIDLADLQATRAYRPISVYAQSKLANLMFAFELQRRSDAERWGIASIAAHPGISRTDLIHNGAGRFSAAGFARSFMWFLFQPAERGALPTLFAATSPTARAGGYYGPDRLSETRGYPAPAKPPQQALDVEMAARLWDVSGRLTGATFQYNAA
ncbi:oxidoreductase [Hyphomicrobium sp.]|uniref:oxidoreductase n=1 Tax=Hyphomicrobium sp. TaxID=82 RepID=UPI003F7085FD